MKKKPIVLVTGSSRGIGRGIAICAAVVGYRVAVHYNSRRDAAEETLQALRAIDGVEHDDVEAFGASLGDGGARERLVEEVFDRFGGLDALVNNAGIAPPVRADIVDAGTESFAEVMKVNLEAPYFLTQAVARRWLSAGTPSDQTAPRNVVFVTSISAVTASTSRGEYCVSKAGLSMAAQLWAARLAAEGVVVVEVRPGITATDMTAGVKEKYDRLIADGLVPQARWATPDDVGRVVAAVLRGELAFSTGSIVNVDGGLLIPRL